MGTGDQRTNRTPSAAPQPCVDHEAYTESATEAEAPAPEFCLPLPGERGDLSGEPGADALTQWRSGAKPGG